MPSVSGYDPFEEIRHLRWLLEKVTEERDRLRLELRGKDVVTVGDAVISIDSMESQERWRK